LLLLHHAEISFSLAYCCGISIAVERHVIRNPIWLVAVLLLACVQIAQAQQPGKITSIGFLWADEPVSARVEELRQGLRDFGYVHGHNLVIENRYAEGKLERLPELAAELVRLKVDVIIVPGSTPGALAAKNATRAIPIVFLGVSNPVATGLVHSLAWPGGNLTGLTNVTSELSGKRLELLKETIPKLSRVAVLWNSRATGSALSWKENQVAARELGLQLHSMDVSSASDFENAFKDAIKARSGALAVTGNPLFGPNQKRIADLAANARLASLFISSDYVYAGGLMSYGPNRSDLYRRAAYYVDKILKGAKPADLPVEQPTKFELVINLKTAKQIGLTIPPNVLARADKVIR
jgi:putative ABC transport system substrate-binding protein